MVRSDICRCRTQWRCYGRLSPVTRVMVATIFFGVVALLATVRAESIGVPLADRQDASNGKIVEDVASTGQGSSQTTRVDGAMDAAAPNAGSKSLGAPSSSSMTSQADKEGTAAHVAGSPGGLASVVLDTIADDAVLHQDKAVQTPRTPARETTLPVESVPAAHKCKVESGSDVNPMSTVATSGVVEVGGATSDDQLSASHIGADAPSAGTDSTPETKAYEATTTEREDLFIAEGSSPAPPHSRAPQEDHSREEDTDTFRIAARAAAAAAAEATQDPIAQAADGGRNKLGGETLAATGKTLIEAAASPLEHFADDHDDLHKWQGTFYEDDVQDIYGTASPGAVAGGNEGSIAAAASRPLSSSSGAAEVHQEATGAVTTTTDKDRDDTIAAVDDDTAMAHEEAQRFHVGGHHGAHEKKPEADQASASRHAASPKPRLSSSSSSQTTLLSRKREHARNHRRAHRASAPPSRLALSYLYYHALEALYVDENVELFVQRARGAAPYGHARLNWLLGVLHAYGVGVPRSERDALLYYSFAAMEAVPEAHMALGYRYKLGMGVPVSCESALAHYGEAADAVAMTYDGSVSSAEGGWGPSTAGAKTISTGKGGRNSASSSFFAYRDDTISSDLRRQRRLDLLSLNFQVDMGNVEAMLTLGYLFLRGDQHVVRDGRRAASYFTMAANKGAARAHGALGQLYMAGDSSITPPLLPDMPRALHHFRMGAVQGDGLSLNGLGFLHAIGYLHNNTQYRAFNDHHANKEEATGVGKQMGETTTTTTTAAADATDAPMTGAPDFITAADYFHQSRSTEGIYNLGVLYRYGRGVEVDLARARSHFEVAARLGSLLAQWQLANMLSEGGRIGGTLSAKVCEQALALYQRTASHGSWHHRSTVNPASLTASFSYSPPSATTPAQAKDGDGDDVSLTGWLRHRQQRHRDEEVMDAETGDAGDGGVPTHAATTDNGPWPNPFEDGLLDYYDDEDENAETANDEGHRMEGFAPSISDAEYQLMLSEILGRLHAVEESLVASDEEEGSAAVSVASFVELLCLAETGDGASAWLASRYVDNYLRVAEPTLSEGVGGTEESEVDSATTNAPAGMAAEKVGEGEGAVTLWWPVPKTAVSSSFSAARAPQFLSAEAASSELLYHLLQRSVLHDTRRSTTLGSAYLRLGNFFYYGESPRFGVDMARALDYYRIAGDEHLDAQALFNVGFMYQLGLHKAPRVTRVGRSASFHDGAGDARRQQPSPNADSDGAASPSVIDGWKIHSQPPIYLRGAPAVFLALKAVSNAWNSASTDPMARGVDLYMAWHYYMASLREEGRGALAVRFAMATLNVQWSLRHFAVLGAEASSFLEGMTRGVLRSDSTAASTIVAASEPTPALRPPTAILDAGQVDDMHGIASSLGMIMKVKMEHARFHIREALRMLWSWYMALEQVVLYGSIALFVAGLLIRHQLA